ncbi:MAG: cell surface protein SprA [candidate division Zixibacteria bacterium]|nr:cell surface protein SprA [candidate division Zixibacteria bacterium]
MSIAIKKYSWLDAGKVRPVDKTRIEPGTLMFTFTRTYSFHPTFAPIAIHYPTSVEPREFNRQRNETNASDYWKIGLMRSIAKDQADKAQGLLTFSIPIHVPRAVEALIGEGGVGLRVNGYYRVSFDGRSQWDDKTQVAAFKQSKFPSLNMEQVSQFKITGNIGSKIEVKVDQDSKRQTDLDNRIQIRYQGTEDEILQTIEAGNTNLALPNTQFVGYSSRVQGLFGIKATAQLGNLGMTVITSQEKGNTEKSSFTAGAQRSVKYIRDYDYLTNTFFDLGRIGGPADVGDTDYDLFRGVDKIVDFRLYINETRTDLEVQKIHGFAYIDPRDTTQYSSEIYETDWLEIDRNKYFFYENELYLEMLTYVGVQQDLACWMTVERGGSRYEVGSLSNPDTLHLKLIKRASAPPDVPTFHYEWKRVYSLGARNIDPDGLEIKIYKGKQGEETREDANLDHQDGTPYLQLMGLDQQDLNGNPNPDGKLDITDQTVFLERGFLFFPNREPFNNPDSLNEVVPEIYNSVNSQDIREASKYYIAVSLAERQTEFSLGKINIIEGSEVVTLNGRRLTKDTDYTIYYDLGRIIFRSEEVLDPNANVTVDFEYQPFIAAEKKSLFGARLEYVLSKDFKFGTTILYKSEKSTDRKPRVGQEESKYLVWDSDFQTSFELPILTDMFDMLPLLEATTDSRMTISGEIAQSVPNPNTLGEAFIDDFEGAREAYGLSVLRHAWTTASPPLDGSGYTSTVNPSFFTNDSINPRSRLIWYNPWSETPVTDIWNRDVQDRDNRTNTMIVRIDPDSTALEESWAGIMRPLGRGSWDQSRTQFLEIRMRRPFVDPTHGQLRIYLGEITEDINGNRKWDTEDKNFNDILEDEEDVGLDGWTDAQERDSLGSTAADPSLDNWFYSDDDKDNYEGINGTQNNASDPARGYYPDSEDINRDKSLNTRNNYYEYVLDFANDTKYLVENSQNERGWVTYRIPLDEPDDSAGEATLDQVSFARIILTGFSHRDSLEFASMDLVSTRWLVQPLETPLPQASMSAGASEDEETRFDVSVINTEEFADTVYTPPPDVEGYYDKVNETREKEQSLWLRFFNFDPGTRGIAERILFRGENYAGYRRLQMYVHSATTADSSIEFIFRMGTDSQNFYEFHTRIYGTDSTSLGKNYWDQRNWVDIDFDAITQVKDSLLKLRQEIADTNYLSVGRYGVKGNPRLTNIIYLAAGVQRSADAPPDPESGEIWLDELRVTDVRRDKGVAKRISVTTSIADIGSFSMNYRKKDAFFRQLTAADRNNLGAGSEETSLSISTSFNFDKFLPPQWGARIPISYSWSKSVRVPRLKSGSDIVITEKDREAETSRNYSNNFRISSKFAKKTNNWLWNLTLNKINTSFSYSSSNAQSPTQPKSESENYAAHADYSLNPGNKTIRIFGWTSFIPFFPSAITNTALGYSPSKLSFKGDVSRKQTLSVNNEGRIFSTYDRRFTGSGSAQYNLFGSLPLSFNFSTDRDLRDPETLKFSFNPKEFKLGVELVRRQSFTGSYEPKIFNFLSTKLSYKSSYDENSDPKRYKDGSRLASTSSNWTLSSKFDSQRFFGAGSKGKGGSGKGGDFVLFKPFLLIIRPISNRIDPVTLSYSQDNRFSSSGLVDRPSLKFQFGFTKDPGVEIIQSSGSSVSRFTDSKSETYSAKSGIDFILGSKISSGYSKRTQTSRANDLETISTSFPDLSVNIGRLERFRIIGWLFKSFAVNSSYSKKLDESINKNSGDKEKENITHNFGPLLGFNVTWLKSVQTQGRYEVSQSINKTITQGVSREQRNWSKSITLSNRYSFRAPTGFKIPLLGRLKIQSTMSLTIDISQRTTKSEQEDTKGNVSPGNERTDFTVAPRATYSFSSNIQGGLQMRWSDTEDKRSRRKSHVRQLGIWVEIRF